MRLVVLVIVDDSDISAQFEKEWIRNVDKEYSNLTIDLFFIHAIKTTCNNAYTITPQCINVNLEETFDNIIKKTCIAFEYVLQTFPKNTFVLRSNMSTLFDFHKFPRLPDNTTNLLFAGSFIGESFKNNLLISGTNILMSFDTLEVMHHELHKLLNTNYIKKNEDVMMSEIMQKRTFNTFNIPRIDFVQDQIIYHKTYKYDDNVYCFRFKSNDRKHDIALYKKLVDYLKDSKSASCFVKNLKYAVLSELEIYKWITDNFFKI